MRTACLAFCLSVIAAAPGAVERPLPRPPDAGPVCGADEFVGRPVLPINGPGGCGADALVEMRSVSGVRLDPPAVMVCDTAYALRRWLEIGVQPAAVAGGRRLVSLDVAAGYACRGRNGIPGAKLSEHGLGRAIDVSAFRLSDGMVATVGSDETGVVAAAREAACGPFATVLGPGADAFHETHLHLDVAKRRHGPYCR